MSNSPVKKYVKAITTTKILKRGLIYELLGSPSGHYLVRVNSWQIRSPKANFEPIK